MKKYLAILLAAIMLVAAFAGCGNKSKGESTGYGTFRDYSTAIPSTMNWLITTDPADTNVMSYCSIYLYMDRINEAKDGWVWTLELASQFPKQLDEEGRLWEVKIRKDFKWANGDPVTIDDVIYTYQQIVDPLQQNLCAGNLSQNTYGTIKNIWEYQFGEVSSWDEVGVKKIDDYTMHIEMSEPSVSINVQRMLNQKLLYKPLYEAGKNADGTATIYGSDLDNYMSGGPFILEEWVKDAKVVLRRNPDYPYKDEIKVEYYTFQQVPDTNTALQLFANGQLDTCSVPYTSAEEYEDDPRIFEYFNDSLMFIWTNLGNPSQGGIFGNLNYREALFYGCDRQDLCDTLGFYPGLRIVKRAVIGNPLTGKPFVDFEQDYVPTVEEAYNLPKAKEYLNKALEECKISTVNMRIIYGDTATHVKGASEFLQRMYEENFDGKVKITFQVVPAAQAYQQRRWNPSNPTSFDSAVGATVPTTGDPRGSFLFYRSTYSPPRYKYADPEFDKMYNDVMNLDLETENDKIIENCQAMEKKILEERIIIPVYEKPDRVLFHERVKLPAGKYIVGFGFGTRWATISE